jgi:uroporphyrinogen-III synthase
LRSPALARLQHLPVFAVGTATANVARALGFSTVYSSEGTAIDLARTIPAGPEPLAGPVLYLRGQDVAIDLAPILEGAGHVVKSAIVYRAVPVKAFAAETIAGIARGTIGATVLMSPRTAETYADLAESSGLTGELAHIVHYCLSRRVAAPLAALADVPVRIPTRPNLQELVALIDLDATQS